MSERAYHRATRRLLRSMAAQVDEIKAARQSDAAAERLRLASERRELVLEEARRLDEEIQFLRTVAR